MSNSCKFKRLQLVPGKKQNSPASKDPVPTPALLSLRLIPSVRLVPGLFALREHHLMRPHQPCKDAAGQMPGEFDLLIEFAPAQPGISYRRPPCRPNRHDETSRDEQGRPELWPVGTICGAANLQPHGWQYSEQKANTRRRESTLGLPARASQGSRTGNWPCAIIRDWLWRPATATRHTLLIAVEERPPCVSVACSTGFSSPGSR